jgi:hypothetical protein
MPRALPTLCGFTPATYRGHPITEKGLAAGTLTDKDTHFGINGSVIKAVGMRYPYCKCGPRAIDMQKRGGDVAETLWRIWQESPADTHPDQLKKFLVTFDEVGGGLHKAGQNVPTSYAYPTGARIEKRPVEGHPKYAPGARDKTLASLSDADMDGAQEQWGARWSKVALEVTLLNGGGVHFHLDGLGDIGALLDKQGEYNYGTTARELRYVKRNWDRFKAHTTFYNGYAATGFDEYTAVVVETPWS